MDGKLMEGELVERARARQIYEEIVRRQKDPALLEWQGGNRFKTQIFPIPANGDKQVILAYEQILPRRGGDTVYQYRLPKITSAGKNPFIGRFDFSLAGKDVAVTEVSGHKARSTGSSVEIHSRDFDPPGPIDVHLSLKGSKEASVHYAQWKYEKFFILDFSPELPDRATTGVRNLVLAIDSSAGIGQRVLDQVKETAAGLVKGLGPDGAFNIVHGDYSVKACFDKPQSSGAADRIRECLDPLDAGGATNIEALFKASVEAARQFKAPVMVVAFTDGMPSLGEMDADLLKAGLSKALGGSSVFASTVAVGHQPDQEFLDGVARAGKGHSLRLTPADAPEASAVRIAGRIADPVLMDVTVSALSGTIEGLVPHKSVNIGYGEAIAVMGRLEEGKARIGVRGKYLVKSGDGLSEKEFNRTYDMAAPAAPGKRTLVDFWARGVIEEMQAKGVPAKKVVETSLRYGVMSRYTSFLVLESEQQYRQYCVGRLREAERLEREAEGDRGTVMQKSGERLQDVVEQQRGDKADIKRKTMIDFQDDTIQGDITRPDGEFIQSRAAPARQSLAAGAIPKKFDRRPEPPASSAPEPQDKFRAETSRAGRSLYAKQQIDPSIAIVEKPSSGFFDWLFGSRSEPVDHREQQIEDMEDDLDELSTDEKVRLIILYLAKDREYKARKVAKSIRSAFSGLEPANASHHLNALTRLNGLAIARNLFEGWTSGNQSPERIYQVLTIQPNLRAHFAQELYEVTAKLIDAGKVPPDVVNNHLLAGNQLGKTTEMAPRILALCKENADDEQAFAWLSQVSADKTVQERMKAIYGGRIAALKAARREDMGNLEHIHRLAEMLQATGDERGAFRILSEVVEFDPRGHATRKRYASMLETRKRVEEACGQYATAAQLDPADRDVFKTITGMRRVSPEKAPAMRSCLVDGVSKLPVRRALSLVLTWEDPHADVDLHVMEPNSEHVYYQHQQSANGGFLYYDITNGFGPEIYTLGTGPSGKYLVNVVYYAGRATDVKGTLTILRDAGSPNETREDRSFTLTAPDSNAPLRLGEIEL
ncbi:MAG: hypothetical protein HY897_22580 [Deltaproteobacteria bacterium]|nr:hypothetical protein [Deltaproteobacteria bacterium]